MFVCLLLYAASASGSGSAFSRVTNKLKMVGGLSISMTARSEKAPFESCSRLGSRKVAYPITSDISLPSIRIPLLEICFWYLWREFQDPRYSEDFPTIPAHCLFRCRAPVTLYPALGNEGQLKQPSHNAGWLSSRDFS